jgi:ABC-type Mn2+/Zn2+ transport system ATPase subunit
VGAAAPATDLDARVRTQELALGYGARPVLADVTFAVRAGQRVAVLGPNGGGKTTLFRGLLGELDPLAGTIDLGGRLAVVPQTERTRLDFPVSALDVVVMGTLGSRPWWRGPGRSERARSQAALELVGLARLARESFGELSGGQRQRVLIARALVQEASTLLLDEPFTGVDAQSSSHLMDVLARLAREGRALLIATHDVEQARSWDLVLCLNGRQIAFGPPEEILTREVLAQTYGGDVVAVPAGDARGELVILPPHHHHHEGP